ncbi:Fc receptor-like protein 4 isoform X1 [Xenopus laevis]|uniref:Fc receptor-like protein 4 isoform X1 n=2 Tax=Xenopus laevis TaxID=8355 RepID=A0A8J1LJ81_XENLA|nr:Fc receptor-like protein 4 isoform X1 [Xenopus laevis]
MAFLVLIFTLFLSLEISRGAIKPMISLWPNWLPVYNSDPVTLICNVPPSALGNRGFTWYRNKRYLKKKHKQNLTILSAHVSDRGNYQCQTDTSDKSDSLRLDVSADWLVLQAPPTVLQGDTLIIRCHSWNGYKENSVAFYKDDIILHLPVNKSVLNAGKADRNKTGNYKCSKESNRSLLKYSKEEFVYIEELFSSPQIKVSSDQVTEGDHMTITCDTKLSPHRETTELQFVFYRNGHNVQGFSLSNQYGVPSAQLEDSGNYTCEVQTPTGSVRKMSVMTHIHIEDLISTPQITVIPDQVTEGDHMNITCDTKLSPHRETTELQFVFYRNGHNVQGFSLSNQYGVPSAELEDSGNYTCEVQTPTGSVRKRSLVLHMDIQGGSWRSLVAGIVGTLLILLIVGAIVKTRTKLTSCLICQRQPMSDKDIVRTIGSEPKHASGEKSNVSLTMTQSNDYRMDCNSSASGLAMSHDDNYACIDMNHVLKVLSTPASSLEHDKVSVMYAVLKGDNRSEVIGSSNMEDTPNATIYQNFMTSQLQIK